MIAIAMYVSLGVVATLLLGLLIMPLIWRRAIRLTEKRILAEMPISYSELQAEKDMQKAEQAIEMRRLEVLAETRHEEMANRTLKIDALSNKLEDRDQTIKGHLADINDLNKKLTEQKQQTSDTEEKLQATQRDLDGARDAIAQLEENKTSLETSLEETIASFEQDIDERATQINEQKIELAAQMARIESHKQEISDLSARLTTETDLLAETKGLLSQRTSDHEHLKERLEKQQTKIDELQSELADKDSEIGTLNQRLERAQALSNEKSEREDDSDQKLLEAEARRAEAEAKIASLSGQLETQRIYEAQKLQNDQTTVISGLKREKTDLESALKAANQIIDRLDRKLQQKEKKEAAKPVETPLSSSEVKLRDEMKSMARLVAEVAARQEGVKSPIPALLKQEDATRNINNEDGKGNDEKVGGSRIEMEREAGLPDAIPPQSEQNGSTNNGTPTNGTGSNGTRLEDESEPAPKSAWDEVFSLTDRIKQMRKSGEDKKTAS